MSPGDRESGPTQILRLVLFHLHRRIEGHGVQVGEKFREQMNAILLQGPVFRRWEGTRGNWALV
jgi:hypothetical protein